MFSSSPPVQVSSLLYNCPVFVSLLSYNFHLFFSGKDKVHEDSFHQTFGYFTQRFRHECYWWQMVTIARKFLLSFLIVTFAVAPAVCCNNKKERDNDVMKVA